MTDKHKEVGALEGESWYRLSMREVTYSFGIKEETIIEIIDQGIVVAEKNAKGDLYFDNDALKRIRKVLQLNRDLGVNLAGAALALELLEEIDRLHVLLHNSSF